MDTHAVPPGSPPRPPWLVWFGLAVVLGAAAALSFDALRGLALAVSIPEHLTWLLPIAVDAGAAVSCTVWLGGRTHTAAARFAGRMTWSLLAVTVAGNAAQLGMHAHHVAPPWWVAVLVGSIPPAVVGAVVHLVVLLVRAEPDRADSPDPDPDPDLDSPGDSEGWEDPWDRWAKVPAPAEPDSPGLAARSASDLRESGSEARSESVESGSDSPEASPDSPHPDPDLDPLLHPLRTWVDSEGSVPSRERVRTRYKIGAKRADQLRRAVRETP